MKFRFGLNPQLVVKHDTQHVYILREIMKTLLVKCPSMQWRPDGLTIHTAKWFLGAGFLGAHSRPQGLEDNLKHELFKTDRT